MKLSPLQLKHYFLKEFELRTNPHANFDDIPSSELSPYPAFEGIELTNNISLNCGEDPEGEGKPLFLITLSLVGKLAKDSSFPYEFSTVIEGVFIIGHDGDLDQRKQLVVVNGSSMLYGVLREQLLNMSSRFMYGPILLPSADFRSIKKIEKDAKPASKPPATRKPRQSKKVAA